MRLPPITRSHNTILTKGRWESAPTWRGHLSRCHKFRSSQAAAAAQNPSAWGRFAVVDRSSSNSSRFRLYDPTRPPAPKPITRGQRSVHSNLLLANALDLYRSPRKPLSDSKLADIQFLAWLNRPELSVVTAQQILRQTPQLDRRIADLLCDDSDWEKALDQLADKGVTLKDVSRWAWILIPDNPDKRVERFLSDPCHKPLFVLFYIINQMPYFSAPESLSALLSYCEKWYSGPQEAVNDEMRRSWYELGMTPIMFNKMLQKLCDHASRLQHHVLRDVANLAVAYIKGISGIQPNEDRAYKMQCQVFNAALQAVSIPSKRNPYGNMNHNWESLTKLLSLSSRLERSLTIEQDSYRAIRRVLLALPKTDSERVTSTTLATSWPPYRIMRDGMEEKASTEEYLSRTIKAGIMMQEAGYGRKEIDFIMDILGGMAPDGTPTIQTRANLPNQVRTDHYTWAALIRTTRNAQEAWAAFVYPPAPGMKPSFEVYWELITKLVARPADPGHNNRAGDSREVFPFDDVNLSDFEKARIRPPELGNVLSDMFSSGVVIRERHLAWLIRWAPTVDLALDYVDHSGLDEELKSSLRWCLENYKSLPPSVLTNPPRDILHGFIDLLCRLQPNRTASTPHRVPSKFLCRIRYAFRLAQMGWVSVKDSSGRPPWESILDALGRPNIMVNNNKPKNNNLKVLLMATEVMENAEAHCGLSLAMFDSFRQATLKAVFARLPALLDRSSRSSRVALEKEEFLSLYRPQPTAVAVPDQPIYRMGASDERTWRQHLSPIFLGRDSDNPRTACEIIRDASDKLKGTWRALAATGPAREPKANPLVTASHVNSYMRTLAFLGEYEEMALLLWWAVREWAPEMAGNLSLTDAERLARAVRAFRAYAEPMLGKEAVVPLRKEIMSLDHKTSKWPIYWPADEEVVEYIQSDAWGNHQNLHEVLELAMAFEKEQPSEA